MKYRTLALGVFAIGTLCGQKKMNWQNLCFNNPGAPVCQGHDYAIKPEKKAGGRKSVKDSTSAAGSAQPSVATQIDWRFVDPGADALAGIDVTALRNSALARNLILQAGAKQGLKEADLQKILEALKGVDQIAVSIYNNHAVALLTGQVSEAMFPAPEPGLRAVQISETALLFGRSEQVDEARQRLTSASTSLSEITRFADDQYGESEFWVIAAPKFAGPQAVSAGVKRLLLAVSMGDQVESDFGLQFFTAPGPEKLKTWQPTLGSATLEGNAVHARRTIETGEAQQKLDELLASPLGAPLAQLISAARYLQPSEAPKRARPVITGLN